MAEQMNLNTKIVHSLLDLGIGEQIEHQHITVEKTETGDFEVWDDGECLTYTDINLAADAIEDSLSDDDWPDVEPRDVVSTFKIVVTQEPSIINGPSADDIERAVGSGLVRWGAQGIKNIDVSLEEN